MQALCNMKAGEKKAWKRILLNVWEVTEAYGSDPITFTMWARLFRKDISDGPAKTHNTNAGRAWERFKSDLGNTPLPFELVRVHMEDPGRRRTSDTWVAIQFPAGTTREVGKILDRIVEEEELIYALAYIKNRALIPAVAAGVHREVKCEKCGASPGLSCIDGGRTLVHGTRVADALAARG